MDLKKFYEAEELIRKINSLEAHLRGIKREREREEKPASLDVLNEYFDLETYEKNVYVDLNNLKKQLEEL